MTCSHLYCIIMDSSLPYSNYPIHAGRPLDGTICAIASDRVCLNGKCVRKSSDFDN